MRIDETTTLLKHHTNRQIQNRRRKQLRRLDRQSKPLQVVVIDLKDVYLPPPYLPQQPHTYGTGKALTVLKTAKTIGQETAL